jgi:hypothetical protein
VSRNDDRGTRLARLSKQLEENITTGRIETVEGLVGEQNREGADQGEGNRGLLPHAVAEFRRKTFAPLIQGQALQEAGGSNAVVDYAVKRPDVLEVLAKAEVVVEDR